MIAKCDTEIRTLGSSYGIGYTGWGIAYEYLAGSF